MIYQKCYGGWFLMATSNGNTIIPQNLMYCDQVVVVTAAAKLQEKAIFHLVEQVKEEAQNLADNLHIITLV